MEFLNLCYKYANKLITANELVDSLEKMKLKDFSKEDKKELKSLINSIKSIIKKGNDEYIDHDKNIIKDLVNDLVGDSIDYNDILEESINNLKIELDKSNESYKIWSEITELINGSEIFNKYFESLDNYELLKFITQYKYVSMPPFINQYEFDDIAQAGILKDEREMLYILALNYEHRRINIDKIIKYFIDVNEGDYLSDLISLMGDSLDIDSIFNSIDDNKLISKIINRKQDMENIVSEEQFKILYDKIGD